MFHRHPTTSFHFRPLNYYFLTTTVIKKWIHNSGLAHKLRIQHVTTSDCKIAILKGIAVYSLRCHLGMLQILFKKTKLSPYTESNITSHIPSSKTALPDAVRTDTWCFYPAHIYPCPPTALILTPQKAELDSLESQTIFALLRKPLPHGTHLFSLHRKSIMSRTRMSHPALTWFQL